MVPKDKNGKKEKKFEKVLYFVNMKNCSCVKRGREGKSIQRKRNGPAERNDRRLQSWRFTGRLGGVRMGGRPEPRVQVRIPEGKAKQKKDKKLPIGEQKKTERPQRTQGKKEKGKSKNLATAET